MSSYCYVDDPNSKSGSTPISEEDCLAVILRIACKHGVEITDQMILDELEKAEKEKRANTRTISAA